MKANLPYQVAFLFITHVSHLLVHYRTLLVSKYSRFVFPPGQVGVHRSDDGETGRKDVEREIRTTELPTATRVARRVSRRGQSW